ncbi:MAG: PH domain-containing protein [Candidatus Heimdallarchaeota archaeon]|nr:MAG: PH domain-containing protein [Candidatus Heimdallarchaeota archaeon]
MNDIRIIKGSDIPPPPGKPRIIRPSKNFLWKNYFLFGILFVVFTAGVVIILGGFLWFLSTLINGDTQRMQLVVDAFYWIGVLYLVLWVMLTIGYLIGMYWYVGAMSFIVHGHEIVVHKGLINKTEKHVPYRTVTNINMRTGPFDRLFRIGTIEIQTAGGRGLAIDETAEEKLEGIKVYREVRDYILTQLRQFQAAYGTTVSPAEEEPQTSIPQQMLSELRDIKGVMSTRLEKIESKLDELDKKLEKLHKPY